MKLVATRKQEQNQAPVDPWTVVHFATGLAAGLMSVPREISFTAAVTYELFEQYAERTEWGQEILETAGPESLANVAMDLSAFALGQWAGERWNERTG